jgi:hypothetical protein
MWFIIWWRNILQLFYIYWCINFIILFIIIFIFTHIILLNTYYILIILFLWLLFNVHTTMITTTSIFPISLSTHLPMNTTVIIWSKWVISWMNSHFINKTIVILILLDVKFYWLVRGYWLMGLYLRLRLILVIRWSFYRWWTWHIWSRLKICYI